MAAKLGLASGADLEFEHLFDTTGPRGLSMAASAPSTWYAAKPKSSVAGAHPWEYAHELHAALSGGIGVAAGNAPDLIEPDLQQDWIYGHAPAIGMLGAAGDACVFEDQDHDVAFRRAEFAWHLGDSFSQLRAARDAASVSSSVIRVVHLDTGYDSKHKTFPRDRFDAALQRNFVDDDRPKDAEDLGMSGVLRNPGHGTGTLSILAGGRFAFSGSGYKFDDTLGGTNRARIVPVRVGNSVVQITTSSVAQGIGYAADLCAKADTRVDVISMSMGGLASAAWADAVNRAYEAGIVFVAAAGNNYARFGIPFPTRHVVYPARFGRVITACGVMANSKPYYGLGNGVMQGNWGPASCMETALSARTPNVAWARWGCSDIVRMNGQGTSAATPQIGAAAALYLQIHGDSLFDAKQYPEAWMRVEAVRAALFDAARAADDDDDAEKLGNGILQAMASLKVKPAKRGSLQKTDPDKATFPFLKVLTGLGMAGSSNDQMLQLEATQLAQRWSDASVVNPFESAVKDPDRAAARVSEAETRRYLELICDHPEASQQLRARAESVLGKNRARGGPTPKIPEPRKPIMTRNSVNAPPSKTDGPGRTPGPPNPVHFVPPVPPLRMLRGYALDPSLATSLDTVIISEITFGVPWEPLKPGPVGEYLEVIDVDPASNCSYDPINLDDPALLAQQGLPPSEGIPQFHQQMVYAVASQTIDHFERALGRRTLWRPGPPPQGASEKDDSNFVRRLRIYPHALRATNAYYSPTKIALLFGYFNASQDDPGDHLPGGKVFTCLSHDVVAHETTHALLDGIHRRFLLPSNPDVYAFHEAFADCVALFQHFTYPEIVRHQISVTRGDISNQENLLGQLASQFGHTTSKRTALRDAIGKLVNDEWVPHKPDPNDYAQMTDGTDPHDRGAILVAAVFAAFLAIYRRRTADLLRLATGGGGVLASGAIHPDLVNRLANEAAKSARHVLTMCIRALDYCPPTDITFGEYLRAIITADHDIVPNDVLKYRVAFIEAFRRRGIYPLGVRTLSDGSLLWRGPKDEVRTPSDALIDIFMDMRDQESKHAFSEDRREIFELQRSMRAKLHERLKNHFAKHAKSADAAILGIDPAVSFEVSIARFTNRIGPDGDALPQLILGLMQASMVPVDPADPEGPAMAFEGGSTIIVDLQSRDIRYCIRKSSSSADRLERQRGFAMREFDDSRDTYLGVRPLSGRASEFGNEPFAMIHRGL
jgi:hypothetical protein